MPRPLLTARWTHAAVISYPLPVDALADLMPEGVEVETRRDEHTSGHERGFVTLRCLEAVSTRVMGVHWPLHTTYRQVDLMIHARSAGQSGVVLVRRYVDKRAIAWWLRRGFNEPVELAAIGFKTEQKTRHLTVEYTIRPTPRPTATPGPGSAEIPPGESDDDGGGDGFGARGEHVVRVTGVKPTVRPGPGTLQDWIKEPRYTFGRSAPGRSRGGGAGGVGGQLLVYETIHPTWSVLEILQALIRVDFGALFGERWAVLAETAPAVTLLAMGSEIAVFPPRDSVPVRWGVKR